MNAGLVVVDGGDECVGSVRRNRGWVDGAVEPNLSGGGVRGGEDDLAGTNGGVTDGDVPGGGEDEIIICSSLNALGG